MYSFSYLEPLCCSMSSSNCSFLTYIQISQEAGQVVWYSHLFKNCSQFSVIHTVKGFSIVNKTCFSGIPLLSPRSTDVVHCISGSFAFSKPSLYIWKFLVHVLLTPRLKDLSIALLICEMSAIVQ